MKRVKDKYRGQTVYFHVMAELVRAAQYRGMTTYQDIAVIMGLPTSGNLMGRETGYILGEICEDEVIAGLVPWRLASMGRRDRGSSPWRATLAFCKVAKTKRTSGNGSVMWHTMHGNGPC